jgi:hypothetical protein
MCKSELKMKWTERREVSGIPGILSQPHEQMALETIRGDNSLESQFIGQT